MSNDTSNKSWTKSQENQPHAELGKLQALYSMHSAKMQQIKENVTIITNMLKERGATPPPESFLLSINQQSFTKEQHSGSTRHNLKVELAVIARAPGELDYIISEQQKMIIVLGKIPRDISKNRTVKAKINATKPVVAEGDTVNLQGYTLEEAIKDITPQEIMFRVNQLKEESAHLAICVHNLSNRFKVSQVSDASSKDENSELSKQVNMVIMAATNSLKSAEDVQTSLRSKKINKDMFIELRDGARNDSKEVSACVRKLKTYLQEYPLTTIKMVIEFGIEASKAARTAAIAANAAVGALHALDAAKLAVEEVLDKKCHYESAKLRLKSAPTIAGKDLKNAQLHAKEKERTAIMAQKNVVLKAQAALLQKTKAIKCFAALKNRADKI